MIYIMYYVNFLIVMERKVQLKLKLIQTLTYSISSYFMKTRPSLATEISKSVQVGSVIDKLKLAMGYL